MNIQQQQLTPDAWSLIISMSETIHKSRLVRGVNSPEAAAFALMKCYELGFPFSSLGTALAVITTTGGTTVALTSQGMLALIQSRPDVFGLEIKESTTERCTVRMWRKDSPIDFTLTYTLEQARAAGLVRDKGMPWDVYPEVMLRWRTISMVAKIVASDLLMGACLGSELDNSILDDAEVGHAD